MRVIIAVVLVVTAAALTAALPEKRYFDINDHEKCWQIFESFITEHNKQYPSQEEKLNRFKIFLENLERINEHNKNSPTSVHDIHKHADLTSKEFSRLFTGHKKRPHYLPSNSIDISGLSLEGVPDSFDWRDKGVVSRVKDQGQCGSCWAFSVIGNVESQYAIKYKKIIELSEQQLVSCDQDDEACCGGYLQNAFIALKNFTGVVTEEDYPYKADILSFDENSYCLFNNHSKIAVKVTDYNYYDLRNVSEDKLKALLYKNGPISVTVDSGPMQSYYTGVLQDCKHHNIDHAVLLVGYGVEEDGTPYWILKNSWGVAANLGGYVKMLRGKNCLSILNDDAGSAIIE